MMSRSGEEQKPGAKATEATAAMPEVIGVRRHVRGQRAAATRPARPSRQAGSMPGSSPQGHGGYFDEVVDTLPVRPARTALRRRSNAWWSSGTN